MKIDAYDHQMNEANWKDCINRDFENDIVKNTIGLDKGFLYV